MRVSRVSSFLAVVAVAALLLPSDVALAHTVRFPTHLAVSRSPGGMVDPGTNVTFTGKLSSKKRACINNSKIKVIKVGKGVVGARHTDATGNFEFSTKVRETARWRFVYPGEVLKSVHPHNHTCKSSSDSLKVPVG